MIPQYRQTFTEEARELLAELESALLKLDANPEDGEEVGRAFRALHTIKGSGAMFGFEDIAQLAHHLESAFDRLRRGELVATAGLINLALAAGDQIRTMLDAPDGAGESDASRTAEIVAGLLEWSGSSEEACKQAARPPSAQIREWQIRFRPGRNLLLNGIRPPLLFDELRRIGRLQVKADASGIPLLSEIVPGECCLSWNLVLATAASPDEIRDTFIFAEGESDLEIEAAPANEFAPAATPSPAETVASPTTVAEVSSSSIRVSVDKLDELVNLVGELVTVQARLSQVATRSGDADMLEISESVDRLATALRENSIGIRMLPLKGTFERFRRLVHDLGIELHKEVELTIEGGETELDKTVIDQLKDPLLHLIRNAMDHGIETPEVRVATGKRRVARIRLSAEHSGGHVLVRVADDGRGLNVEEVRERALQQGLIAQDARLSESEVLGLLLAPGFSTASKVTDISGRGVGMDVVRRSLEALRGSVEVESRPGAGVTVTLRLPLTLAIIDGLLVRVGRAHFVLPLANSLECVELTRREIEEANGRHIAYVRGRIIPYIRLSEYLRIDREPPDREQIMVVETEHGHYGFVVDQVLGDHQTVIKNLGRLYRNVQEVSGATILGNGSVALILDPHRLVQGAIQSSSLEYRDRFVRGKYTQDRLSFQKENRSNATQIQDQ